MSQLSDSVSSAVPSPSASVPGAPEAPQAQQPVIQPVTQAAGRAAIFMVLNIAPGEAAEQGVRDYFGTAAALTRSLSRRFPQGQLNCVVGIGSAAWDRLFGASGAPRPAGLHPFKELHGDKHAAPSTPGDLLLHLRAATPDLCFELATQIMRTLGDAVEPVDEVHGFRYLDARSMVGFVDGTENPEGREALEATIIGDEDPEFAGGSYVIVQKYLHDMKAWNTLSTEEQERVIGRTKHDDVELADDVKPANSHIALNVIEDEDGNELAILRDNLPFGSPSRGEFGTFFIGYARTPAVTEQMLENMFIGRPPGNYDRLLDFSTAVTGCLFFVPSADMLEALADGNPNAEAADAPSAPSVEASGELEIGSLKGQPQGTSIS